MKSFFGSFTFLSSLTVITMVAFSLAPAQGQQTSDTHALRAPTAADMPYARTMTGNFLAGRFAQRNQDWDAAQHYMNEVVRFDPQNELLVQRTFLLSVGAGNHERARALGADIVKTHTSNNELALIYSASDALAREDYTAAIDFIGRLPEDGFGQYTKPLLTAWAMAGKGDAMEAVAFLRSHTEETDPTFNIHAGLMMELAKNMDAAAAHYRLAMEDGLTLHNALLLAGFFERHGDVDTAKKIYSGLGDLYTFNPFLHRIAEVGTGAKPAANISKASEGAAVALFDLATLLYERRAYDSAQIYARMVQVLKPSSDFGALMVGDIAAVVEQYPQAVRAYEGIRETSSIYWLSRLRVAEIFEASDHMDDAVALLNDLAQKPQTRIQALVTLGDVYRRHEKFTDAITAYDAVLGEVGDITEDHWPVVYARGMALERSNNWDRAEKDLLQALSFQPDNAMILNYIGYTWADKGVNLEKAMGFIRRAVEQRPDDGYILDSYGWAFYRMGNFDEAVAWLEKAVAYVPDDSAILDHLGDAYWQTGRKAEARFKWQRAREVSKDADFRGSVQAKMLNGIDVQPTVVVQKDGSL